MAVLKIVCFTLVLAAVDAGWWYRPKCDVNYISCLNRNCTSDADCPDPRAQCVTRTATSSTVPSFETSKSCEIRICNNEGEDCPGANFMTCTGGRCRSKRDCTEPADCGTPEEGFTYACVTCNTGYGWGWRSSSFNFCNSTAN